MALDGGVDDVASCFNEHPQLAKLSKNEYVREVKYDSVIFYKDVKETV